jgi:hypothetical protein
MSKPIRNNRGHRSAVKGIEAVHAASLRADVIEAPGPWLGSEANYAGPDAARIAKIEVELAAFWAMYAPETGKRAAEYLSTK